MKNSYYFTIDLALKLLDCGYLWTLSDKHNFDQFTRYHKSNGIEREPFRDRSLAYQTNRANKPWNKKDVNLLKELNRLNTPLILMSIYLDRSENAIKQKMS